MIEGGDDFGVSENFTINLGLEGDLKVQKSTPPPPLKWHIIFEIMIK